MGNVDGTDRERAEVVIGQLSAMILYSSRLVASEQYAPRANADESDDIIKERLEFITELRAIRERFENLITGVIPAPVRRPTEAPRAPFE